MTSLSVWEKPYKPLAVLLIIYIILALSYNISVPIWEAPDEPAHFGYIQHLHNTKTFPIYPVTGGAEGFQPPLYYLLLSLLTFPTDVNSATGAFSVQDDFIWRGGSSIMISSHGSAETFPYRGQVLAVRLSRLLSTLLGAATVFITWRMGSLLFPKSQAIPLFGAAVVALNPQFLSISSSINNDNLVAFVASALFLQLIYAMRQPQQYYQWTLVGTGWGIAALSKTSALVLGAVIGVALLSSAVRLKSLMQFFYGAGAIALSFLVIAGWWLVRNWTVYGDPLGWSAIAESSGADVEVIWGAWITIEQFLWKQFTSFWGNFGWMTVPLPNWIYGFFCVLTASALIGLLSLAIRSFFERSKISQKDQRQTLIIIAIFAFALIVQEAAILWMWRSSHPINSWYQGRYLFIVIAPAGLLFSIGLLQILPQRFARATANLLTTLLVAVSIYALWGVIRPAYAIIPEPKYVLWNRSNQVDYRFADQIALRDYKLNIENEVISVKLTWQALKIPDFNYSASVQLIDSTGNILAQNDGAPGEEQNYPPALWKVEDIVSSHHKIVLPQEVVPIIKNQDNQWRIVLYNWRSGERLPVFKGEEAFGTFALLE